MAAAVKMTVKPNKLKLSGGAGTFRGYPEYRPRPLPPPTRSQYVSAGCQRCLEAIPTRLDASKTHATKDCRWPPNTAQNSRPNFQVVLIPEEENVNTEDYLSSQFYRSPSNQTINLNALPIRKVQTLSVKINEVLEILTIDSGSEGNCIRLDTCKKLNLPILPLDKDDRSIPMQADGQSKLQIVGHNF